MDGDLGRRAALRKLGVGAAAAWATPVLLTANSPAGAAGSPMPATTTTTPSTTTPSTTTTTTIALGACIKSSSITARFNGTSIAAGRSIWFSAVA